MHNIYLKSNCLTKTKKKVSELKQSTLDYLLQYSQSVDLLATSDKVIILSKN